MPPRRTGMLNHTAAKEASGQYLPDSPEEHDERLYEEGRGAESSVDDLQPGGEVVPRDMNSPSREKHQAPDCKN